MHLRSLSPAASNAGEDNASAPEVEAYAASISGEIISAHRVARVVHRIVEGALARLRNKNGCHYLVQAITTCIMAASCKLQAVCMPLLPLPRQLLLLTHTISALPPTSQVEVRLHLHRPPQFPNVNLEKNAKYLRP
jgi:hypothetical protein